MALNNEPVVLKSEIDSTGLQEIALDSLGGEAGMDTLEMHQYGIVLTPPVASMAAPPRSSGSTGISFILCGLFILFLVIALRFRNNMRYAVTMFHNLTETRTRQNVFNDTVRETSLLVLLNILWCACAGIVVFCVWQNFHSDSWTTSQRAVGMLWGMLVAGIYALFMWWAYAAIGWVFSDRSHVELWVKGYSASHALTAPLFFITALVGICQPQLAIGVGTATAIVFITAKLAFIWKGYRIFFNQFSSWVLFLCYLCSLEIVPLILCYRLALLLEKML